LETDKLLIWSIESEVDEMWSFVGEQGKQAMDLDSHVCQEQTDHRFLCWRSLTRERQKAMGVNTEKLPR